MINWQDTYLQLYAYTDQLLKAHSWFRRTIKGSSIQGKEVHDYVAEAIEKYLQAPENYDSTSGRSLVNYLKYHIIRTLIGNDAKSAENRKTTDIQIFAAQEEGTYNDSASLIETLIPHVSCFFDQELDYDKIVSEIRCELADDKLALSIFDNVRCQNLNRRDLILLDDIEPKEYDKAMKRLNRVTKKIGKKYYITERHEK